MVVARSSSSRLHTSVRLAAGSKCDVGGLPVILNCVVELDVSSSVTKKQHRLLQLLLWYDQWP